MLALNTKTIKIYLLPENLGQLNNLNIGLEHSVLMFWIGIYSSYLFELTLPKIPRKGGMEKLLKGSGDPKKGGLCSKGGMLLFFSSWGVANVTTVTSNYILVIVI